jgi:hypothetical protein
MSIHRVWLVRTGLSLLALILPVLSCFAQPQPPAMRVGNLAQIASGGGWVTTITLINLSASSVPARIEFHDDNGQPLRLRLDYPQSGESSITSSEDPVIPPNGSVVIETGARTPATVVGWAHVESRLPLGGYAIFRFTSPGLPPSEGTVSLDASEQSSLVIPYDNTNGYVTGLAFVNQSSSLAGITLTLFDDNGVQLSTFPGGIAALGHASLFVKEIFPISANRRGIIRLQSSGVIAAVGLRFSPSGTFTSVPILR